MDWAALNTPVIEEFRANGGKVGGRFEGSAIVLVHHIGAKTGTERIAPLTCYTENGRLFVFASKIGDPAHPAWFHNLVANPDVTIEVGEETYKVRARVLEQPERDEVFAKQVEAHPRFGEYQAKTDRVIPVVELVRR